MTGLPTFAPLARVVRSGFVEGVHHGVAVALGADGSPKLSVGTPSEPLFPRSAVKPLQAVAMLRAGLPLAGRDDARLLALSAASHSGEDFHLDGVRTLLARFSLPENALRNTPDLPLDPDEAHRWRATGRGPTSPAQNCSGKHAAMLATCAVNGWPLEGYLAPDHPLQVAIRAGVEELTGAAVTAVGVDGCGAPVLAVPLDGLAAAFARVATAPDGSPERAVADAVRAHPEWLGGTRRPITRLIRGVPGLVAKDGAESVWAAAFPDGRAFALKVADGGARAVGPVSAALLRALGEESPFVDSFGDEPILGHGEPVGAVESLL
ncbi:asparaginase [Spongisporangium articulatum]|uniref:Asparaginase n=1 Tax=Spongisporangium articulatum TaxID=3362603 RepID=A0ABW8AM88_9ACTN